MNLWLYLFVENSSLLICSEIIPVRVAFDAVRKNKYTIYGWPGRFERTRIYRKYDEAGVFTLTRHVAFPRPA